MKVAIVTDWLTSRGGAEKVCKHLAEIYPEADIYTSIYNPKNFPEFKNRQVYTSFLNKFPFAKNKYFMYLFLMPLAFESFDLNKYDLVINSSWACSKGVITKTKTLHVAYCHNPTRYVWEGWQNYLQQFNIPQLLKLIAKPFLHKLRIWDYLASQRVDLYIANSTTVKERIQKYYQRDATVINPAVNDRKIKAQSKKQNYYLTGGRLVPYKQYELVIQAFNQNKKHLKIYGKGRLLKKLQKLNTNPNTEFLGYVSDKQHQELLENAQAFIFQQVEDFGIVAAESIQHGCPLIAFAKGGINDILQAGKNGIFFQEQSPASLNSAIEKFENMSFDVKTILESSESFRKQHFQKQIKDFIQSHLNEQNTI